MLAKIVSIIKTSVNNSIKAALVEVFKNDIQEHTILTLPGFETAPLGADKLLLIKIDKSGKAVLVGTPLKTDIADGEVKINGRSSNGNTECFLYLKNNGVAQIGKKDFKKLINEEFKNIFEFHQHPLDLSTLTALPTTSKITKNAITKSLEGE